MNVLLKYVTKQLETKYMLWIDICPNFPDTAKAGWPNAIYKRGVMHAQQHCCTSEHLKQD